MNIYIILAMLCNIVHIIIMASFIFSSHLLRRWPLLDRTLLLAGSVALVSYVVFLGGCPMTILSGYLIKLGRGETNGGVEVIPFIGESYTVKILRDVFGFQIPEVIATILAVMLATAVVANAILTRHPDLIKKIILETKVNLQQDLSEK